MIAGYCVVPTRDGWRRVQWTKGLPTHATLLGMELPALRVDQDDLYPITTYACNRCGYVESFHR